MTRTETEKLRRELKAVKEQLRNYTKMHLSSTRQRVAIRNLIDDVMGWDPELRYRLSKRHKLDSWAGAMGAILLLLKLYVERGKQVQQLRKALLQKRMTRTMEKLRARP